MTRLKPAVLLGFLLSIAAGSIPQAWGAYQAPAYPQYSPAISKMTVDCGRTVQAGTAVKIAFRMDVATAVPGWRA